MAIYMTCANCGASYLPYNFNNSPYCQGCRQQFIHQAWNNRANRGISNNWAAWPSISQPARMWYAYSEAEYEDMFNQEANAKMLQINQLTLLERVVLYSPWIDSFESDTFSEMLSYALRIRHHKINAAAILIFKELKRRVQEVKDQQATMLKHKADIEDAVALFTSKKGSQTAKGLEDLIAQWKKRMDEKKEKEKNGL